jgi:DeoR family glucitol operon repressor
LKQVFARRAKKIVLLVDSTKFGQRALAKVLDIHEIDLVITDMAIHADDMAQLADLGLEVLCAADSEESQNVA